MEFSKGEVDPKVFTESDLGDGIGISADNARVGNQINPPYRLYRVDTDAVAGWAIDDAKINII
ncbi:hypothetical protein ACUNV4_30155, partial [Granulosicoccus sp. 3-233]|uniref:hypothetical protein n=1 Tax=Granulosicoccus sp. 3-233 TaxID=3417969 RepID=UPI003D3282C7